MGLLWARREEWSPQLAESGEGVEGAHGSLLGEQRVNDSSVSLQRRVSAFEYTGRAIRLQSDSSRDRVAPAIHD